MNKLDRLRALRPGVLVFVLFLARASAYADGAGSVLGVEDDLTVLGTGGTSADADLEVKGYSVFGSSGGDAGSVTQGVGNVFVAGSVEIGTNLYVGNNVSAASFSGSGHLLSGITNTGIDCIWFCRTNPSGNWNQNTAAEDWSPDEFLVAFNPEDYTQNGTVEIKLRIYGQSDNGNDFYAGIRDDTAGVWPVPHTQTHLGAAGWWDSPWGTATNTGISELHVSAYTANSANWYYIKRAMLLIRYTKANDD